MNKSSTRTSVSCFINTSGCFAGRLLLCCFLCVFMFVFMSLGGAVDAERFRLLSGGKPSRKCGIMSSGNHLFFSEDGLRMLVTNDMDLSNAR